MTAASHAERKAARKAADANRKQSQAQARKTR
jgi:hypothetical protein